MINPYLYFGLFNFIHNFASFIFSEPFWNISTAIDTLGATVVEVISLLMIRTERTFNIKKEEYFIYLQKLE